MKKIGCWNGRNKLCVNPPQSLRKDQKIRCIAIEFYAARLTKPIDNLYFQTKLAYHAAKSISGVSNYLNSN